MKQSIFIVLTVTIIMAFFLGISYSDSDEICCTWVNTAYTSGNPCQKLLYNYDGTFERYPSIVSRDALSRGTFNIVKKWSDSQGNKLYQIRMHCQTVDKSYVLAKISDNGNLLEFVLNSEGFPDQITLDDSDYFKYNRHRGSN